MNKIMNATAARKNFFAMLKAIETPGVSITITYEGQPKGVFMSIEDFEGWMETLDILSDPKEAAAVRAALRDKGDTVSLDELKKSLHL